MSTETYNLMTKSQEITVAALTVLGGSLSLLGSTTIIYNIISKQKFKRDSYHRLLLGTCAFDFISSAGWITSSFAAPQDTSVRYLSIGNVASCTASGFMVQCSVAYMIYNACLTIYFFVTIRYNFTEVWVLRMEKSMHAISIVWGLGCAIAPLPLQLYNENSVGPGCWLNDYPNDCYDTPGIECIRGGAICSRLVGYVIAAIPVSLALIVVLVSNFLVYRTARAKELATQKVTRRYSETLTNEQQHKRTNSIASQASWYVLVFMNSVLWQLTLRFLAIFDGITRENESQWTVLIALSHFFSSSSGFGFLLVFVRPRYLRFRERDHLTPWGAFLAALSFDNSKRQRRPRGSSTSQQLKRRRSVNAYLDDSVSLRRASATTNDGGASAIVVSGLADLHLEDELPSCELTTNPSALLEETSKTVEGVVA